MFPISSRCVDGLFEALSQIYNDQESSSVLRLTQKVAAVFAKGNRFADGAELEELKQLRADAQASLLFPTTYVTRQYFLHGNVTTCPKV